MVTTRMQPLLPAFSAPTIKYRFYRTKLFAWLHWISDNSFNAFAPFSSVLVSATMEMIDA